MNREELDSIVIQTIYMNTNLEITKMDKETVKLQRTPGVPLDQNHFERNLNNEVQKNVYNTNHKCISKEQLLQIIQTKKVIEKTKYKLFDMILFTVDLDPRDIQKYVNGECKEKSKLKSIPIVSDIIISPSLFIFHSLHTFFIFFTEIVEEIPIKSILKTAQNDGKKPKHTKKVRIADMASADDNECVIIHTKRPKKTRKNTNNST
jgi:hypothetical protein